MSKRFLICLIIIIFVISLSGCSAFRDAPHAVKMLENKIGVKVPEGLTILYRNSKTYIDGYLSIEVYRTSNTWAKDSGWLTESEKGKTSDYGDNFEIASYIGKINDSKEFGLPEKLRINNLEISWRAILEYSENRYRDYIVIYDNVTSCLYVIQDIHQCP